MTGDVWNSGGPADSPGAARAGAQAAPLALYRRYRPASFAEVKGQEHVTEPLRQALRSGRVHHAYLFSGPRGCGKTSSARILARSLNCEEGPTPDPCGKCASCVALAPSGPGSIDVIEIDAASHGGIDDARDLRERAFYSPVSARYKIYIIDEAHMVTGGGFNALLKLVEEPPPHLKFVFATTEPEKVIPTIRSRTHHYPFRLVPPAVLKDLLEEILRSEGIGFEPPVLPVVIRAGAGSVRDSLSILDQLIAGSGESGLRYDRAIALLGYTDDALLDEVVEAFARSDGAGVFTAIDRVVEAGHDPRRFAADLLDRFRDLIVLATVPDAAASGLIDVPEDRLERMREQATGMGPARLVAAAETVNTGLVEMRGATSPRLQLELICAQVLLPPAAAGTAVVSSPAVPAASGTSLAERVLRLERQLAAGATIAPAAGAAGGPARSAGQAPAAARPGMAPPAEAPGRPEAEPAPRTAPPGQAARPAAVAPGAPGATGTARAASGSPAGGQPAGSAALAPPATPAAAGALDVATLRARWDDVLAAIREVGKVAWILLNSASLGSLEGTVLTVGFDQEGNAKAFSANGYDADLADVLERMFASRLTVRAVVRPAGSPRAGRAADPGNGPAARSDRSPAALDAGDPGAGGQRPASREERPEPAAAAARTGAVASTQPGSDQASSGPGSGRRLPAQRGAGRASSRAPGRASKPDAVPPLADDPRLNTDETPGEVAPGDLLTGSDLIQQALGGQVIADTGEN